MASQEFGCNVACEGIYVDVERDEKYFVFSDTERTQNDDILDGKSFAKMINEYATLRKRYVQHFRYEAKSTNFSKSLVHFALINDLFQELRCLL